METPTATTTPSAPAQRAVLNRQVELEITLDELWSLISEAANLRGWLVDDLDLDLSPGSVGTVVEDGVVRDVRVDRLVPGSLLEFSWWPADEPSEVSVVALRVEQMSPGTSRLNISETLLGVSALSDAGATTRGMTSASRWEIRVLSLWACTVAMALVQ